MAVLCLVLTFSVRGEWVELETCGWAYPIKDPVLNPVTLFQSTKMAPNLGPFFVRKDQVLAIMGIRSANPPCSYLYTPFHRVLVMGTKEELHLRIQTLSEIYSDEFLAGWKAARLQYQNTGGVPPYPPRIPPSTGPTGVADPGRMYPGARAPSEVILPEEPEEIPATTSPDEKEQEVKSVSRRTRRKPKTE